MFLPPRFHVEYGEFNAEIGIETLEVRAGSVPRRALALERAALHRAELLHDWDLCRRHQQPDRIEPLE